MRFVVLALLVTGCGFDTAPAMHVAASCTSASGLRIELEEVPEGTPADALCQWSAQMADGYRSRYQAKWGDPGLTGWTVRVRATTTFDGHAGNTYSNTIDIGSDRWMYLPHELHHVALGRGHTGWCSSFEPWEESELGLNERSYLECH